MSYLENILSRVYKYHRAYKDMLYESFENGILPAYTAGYIDLHQQFSTVGINGMNEAAEFMGITHVLTILIIKNSATLLQVS